MPVRQPAKTLGVQSMANRQMMEPDKFSGPLDLPGKLTLFFKRGIGQKYVARPQSLDPPMKRQHKEYLKSQFEKATNDYYLRIMQIDPDRFRAYEDFAAMEYTPEISSALDIYADECLTKSEEGDVLTIETDNTKIKSVLENLFYDILDVDHNLWNWTRNMCKYGNNYLLLDIQEKRGVVGYLPLPVREIAREEAYDGNVNSVKFNWEMYGLTFDQWQVAHFRLLSDMERFPYGTSMLESSRRTWKQLQLAEDAMIVYRITRAPERRVFYIDVGNLDPSDVENYMKKIKATLKRAPTVEQSTGNVTLRYNPMAVDEDYYIPRRGDKNSEVDTLAGASNLDEIADIEYLQQKMFAALKIPKAFLTFEEDINAKATLAGEDFRFARTINRIQQAVLTELNKIALVHLFSLGFRDRDQLTGFDLQLTNPSTQAEIEKLELLDQRLNVFASAWDETTLSPISLVWGLKNIMKFSDDEIEVILKQQYLEGKMKLEIEDVSGTSPEDLAKISGTGDDFNADSRFGQGSERAGGVVDSARPMERPETETVPRESIALAEKVIREMIKLSSALEPREAILNEVSNSLLIKNSLSAEDSQRMLEQYSPENIMRIDEIDFKSKKKNT